MNSRIDNNHLAHHGTDLLYGKIYNTNQDRDKKENVIWSILRLYYHMTKPYQRNLFYFQLLLSSSTLFSSVFVPLLFAQLIDYIISLQGVDIINSTIILNTSYYFIFIFIASVINVTCTTLAGFTVGHFLPNLVKDLELFCLETIHRQRYEVLANKASGAWVSRVRRFVEGYEYIQFHVSRGVLQIIIEILVAIVITSYYSPLLGVTYLLWGILTFGLTLWLLPWKMRMDRLASSADSDSTATLADSISNFANVKALSLSTYEVEKLDQTSSRKSRYLTQSWLVTSKIQSIINAFNLSFQMIILIVSVYLWFGHLVTTGFIVLVQTYVIRLRSKLDDLETHMKAIFRGLAGAEEMTQIIYNLSQFERDIDSPLKVNNCPVRIEFRKVNFSYLPDVKLFDNFSLNISPGDKIGIVGSSGAGKSTIIKMLFRFIEIKSGSILIDGIDIDNFSLSYLRRLIAYVPQEPILFNRTIRDNVSCGSLEPVSDEEVKLACKRAQLGGLLLNLPDGLDTCVGERGIRLSGGEKQRLAIARAIISKAPILVLDEPTSALDSYNETLIQEALNEAMLNRTTIVIAHRLATIQRLDRIVVLETGEIKEMGTHQELVNKGGIYANLSTYQQLHSVAEYTL
jgi:ATP-binding cassette subfamily B protein